MIERPTPRSTSGRDGAASYQDLVTTMQKHDDAARKPRDPKRTPQPLEPSELGHVTGGTPSIPIPPPAPPPYHR